jgi:hypothetical protein
LLRRIERSGELSAASSRLDGGNEVLDYRQIHVRLKERDPDFPSRRVNIGLGQPAFAAQVLEGGRQAVLQGVEHKRPSVEGWTDSAYSTSGEV